MEEDFDLVHIRMLNGSIADWPSLYAKAFRHLRPGGKIEQVEIDFCPRSENGKMPATASVVQWYNMLMEAMDRRGQPMRLAGDTKERLRNAGFVDIVETTIRVPFNPWSRDRHEQNIGRWFNLGMTHGIEGFTIAPFRRALGMPEAEVHDLIAKVKRDIATLQWHSYCVMSVFVSFAFPSNR